MCQIPVAQAQTNLEVGINGGGPVSVLFQSAASAKIVRFRTPGASEGLSGLMPLSLSCVAGPGDTACVKASILRRIAFTLHAHVALRYVFPTHPSCTKMLYAHHHRQDR